MFTIRAARVFDGERMLDDDTVIVVENDRIVGVETGSVQIPDDVPMREAPGCTLLPGLVDAHVHLCADAGPSALERLADAPAAELSATIEESLRAHLAAGVTTVRDLGDRDGAVLAWRRSEAPGFPAVLAAGTPITSAGGHCWQLGGEANGIAELRDLVRDRAANGADVVKVMASGGVLTPGTDTTRPQFSDAELKAAVEEAHAHGLPITVHAHALLAVEQALSAGVDGIEHCTCLTSEGIRIDADLLTALAGSGTMVCATLGSDPDVFVPPAVLEMAERAGITEEILQRSVARLYDGGAHIVAGSDAGIGPAKPHGLLPRTIADYVAAGLPATAALAAATSGAADACGLDERKGRIRVGHDADLLLVDGDPTADVTALTRPAAVYLAGRPVE